MADYLYIKNIGLIKIPERNTKDQIIGYYNSLTKYEFIELLEKNIIEIDNLYIM